MSVRVRAALVAALVFGVVASLAAIAGIELLRSSLLDEIDRSIETRALDLEIQTADEDFAPFVGAGRDPSTVAAIVDVDGEVLSSTDRVDGPQLRDLYRSTEGPFDVSLPQLESVVGSEMMRAITVRVEESDEFVETFVFVAASTAAVERTVDSATTALTVTVPILALLVGGLVHVLTGRALRPVERIRREVEEITATRLDRRVTEPATGDEIEALAHTMNSMLGRLERADDQQRRFAADASHELRTPLTAITTRLDVDLAHPDTVDWQAGASEMRREAERMRVLIDDLLLLARSESAPRPTGVAALDDVVLDAVAAVGAVRADVDVDVAGVERIDVTGDSEQLERLVRNVVANATRHAESRIVVATRLTNSGVELIVDDDGTGIPKPDHERIFDRFVRLDDARNRDAGGSGLGLAICSEIARRHGGTISATDSPLGGARFVVTLPT